MTLPFVHEPDAVRADPDDLITSATARKMVGNITNMTLWR
jgi:hypothetical protein